MAFVQFPLCLSRTVALAAISAAALCATQANANTISYSTTHAYGNGTTITGEKMQFGTQAVTTPLTGAFWATESPGANSFWVYCLDPLVGAGQSVPETPNGLGPFLNSAAYFGAPGVYTAASLTIDSSTKYAKQADTATVLANLVELYSHAYMDSLTTATKSAAFQYAIWEILGESPGNYGTSVGALKTTNNTDTAFKNQATAYLTALTATGSETTAWTSVGGADLHASATYTYKVYTPNTVGNSQAFLGVVTSTTTNTNGVPEPGTGLLAAMGALAWIGVRRRKQVKNPTV